MQSLASGKQWSAGTAFIAVSQLSAKHVECLTDASTLIATHTMSLEAVNNCERCGGGCRAPLAESCYVCDLLMQLDTPGQMSVAHGLSQEAMMNGGGQGTREALIAERLAPSSLDEEAAVTAVR